MGLSERISSVWDRIRGADSASIIDQGFDFKSFDTGVDRILGANGIYNARNVGGTFRITDQTRESFQRAGIRADFDVATVVLSDTSPKKAVAFMVGRNANGNFDLMWVHNYGRPQDRHSIDRFDARRDSHLVRRTLEAAAELMRTERSINFSPVLQESRRKGSIFSGLFSKPVAAPA
jgi:hypothetical protein